MNIKHDEQQQQQQQQISDNPNRPNPWYAQNLTSSAIAIANQEEKNYLQPFPSPTIPSKDNNKASCSSSCRYSQDKTNEGFAKYANNNPETARQQATTPSSTTFSIMDPVSISPHQMQTHPMQTNNGMFGAHFNPLGYHMPLHQAMSFDSQARTSALPSPTIYPPTPPPSASWIHPWFIGDSF